MLALRLCYRYIGPLVFVFCIYDLLRFLSKCLLNDFACPFGSNFEVSPQIVLNQVAAHLHFHSPQPTHDLQSAILIGSYGVPDQPQRSMGSNWLKFSMCILDEQAVAEVVLNFTLQEGQVHFLRVRENQTVLLVHCDGAILERDFAIGFAINCLSGNFRKAIARGELNLSIPTNHDATEAIVLESTAFNFDVCVL